MKPAPFAYYRPETEAEALSALAEYGDDAVVLAGGLSLGAMLNMRLVFSDIVIDINKLQGFDTIVSEDKNIRTGALVRQADALASPEIAANLPLLRLGLQNVGHYQTRSRGTLGGSVAHADPSAEIPLCLATLGGQVELTSLRGTRQVTARDFAESALATCREADELVTALHWPSHSGSGVAFREIAQRHGDFAIVAVAALARKNADSFEFSLGFGGVEGSPHVLEGRVAGEAAVAESVREFVETLDPMEDPRVSAAYRGALAVHLGTETLLQAFGELS